MPRQTYKLKITSPELWEKVLDKNKKLFEQFLKEKNTRSSDKTIEGYRSDLCIFGTWNYLHNDNKFFVDIRKLEFAEFFSYVVEELKWGSARFSRVRSVLSSLSIFIEKYMDDLHPSFKNVILKSIESMPKNIKREKTILKEDQINKLYLELEKKGEYQIMCWLALAISSGARFSELLRFTIDIIDENNLAFNDIFIETLKPIKCKGRTKSGKVITKYIIKELFWKHYSKWLEIRKDIMTRENKCHNFIFIKNNGDPAQESTVRRWVEKIENTLGIPFYPHSTRHYYTTFLMKNNLPQDLIKDIVGWESSDMIKIYSDLTSKDRDWKELSKFKETLNGN